MIKCIIGVSLISLSIGIVLGFIFAALISANK